MTRSRDMGLVSLIALASLLGGAWFFFGGRQTVDGPLPEAQREGEPPNSVRSESAARAPERERLLSDPVVEPDPEPAPERIAPSGRAEPVTLNGVAIRSEEDGVEHAGDDGSFRVSWRSGGDQESRDVEILGGSWSLVVPPDVGLYLSEMRLGGVPITLEQEHYTVPPDHFLTLRGRARQDVRLHVVSSIDGRELTGVEVWPGPYGFPTDVKHPGATPEGEPVLERATSPVRIPPPEKSWKSAFQYFVRAPGHAWGSIALDHGAGGERTLVLAASARLEVELIGNAGWLEPEVRLWPPDASQWDVYAYAAREPDAEDRAVFDSLAPGTYLASVERGWADRRESYGSALVDVVAGETITLPLTVSLPERPTSVRVSGTLTLPFVWERDGMKLTFSGEGATEKWLPQEKALPLEEMTPLAAEAGFALPHDASEVYAWGIELPVAGSYALDVYPLLVRSLLKVPAGGLEGVDLVVPMPADVEVTVLDAESGAEIPVDALFWSPPPIDGIIATPLYRAVPDPERGRPVFRAPAGEIRLAPVSRGLLPVDEEQTYTVEPGENSLEFRVQQQIGVRFTFRDGEATVPWDWSWRLSAHRVDGEGRDRSRSIGILWFLEEGTYELRSNGIPGFESIDGTRIEVVAGQGLIDVEVSLTRE